jgi:hypothetical protein
MNRHRAILVSYMVVVLLVGAVAVSAQGPRQLLTAVPYAPSLRSGTVISGSGAFPLLNVVNMTTSVLATGVVGSATAGIGIEGKSISGTGVLGQSVAGTAVLGRSTSLTGVQGESTSGDGVYGQSISGIGAGGTSLNGMGVVGQAYSNTGVAGESRTGDGVSGQSNSGTGVSGFSGNVGVYAESPANALFVKNTSVTPTSAYLGAPQWAGVFYGDVFVAGTLAKSAGSFKIDDPLDPANKYLSHSVVESPDMMNVYNGNVTLDAKGEAWVEMPNWFEALNQDFRYQLTPIGAPGPNLYVAKEVSNNRFKIAGGKPNGKVSWQVTGIRHDVYANAHRIPVEVDKSDAERDHYLHPELFGQPDSKSLEHVLFPQVPPEPSPMLPQIPGGGE